MASDIVEILKLGDDRTAVFAEDPSEFTEPFRIRIVRHGVVGFVDISPSAVGVAVNFFDSDRNESGRGGWVSWAELVVP